jgi:ABC-type uncharacterized transport system permease subunit
MIYEIALMVLVPLVIFYIGMTFQLAFLMRYKYNEVGHSFWKSFKLCAAWPYLIVIVIRIVVYREYMKRRYGIDPFSE